LRPTAGGPGDLFPQLLAAVQIALTSGRAPTAGGPAPIWNTI